MRLAAFCSVAVFVASTAVAQLTPGPVEVAGGQGFPVVADFNGDGLDDLIHERFVVVSTGDGLGAPQLWSFRAQEAVIAAGDVNGDRVLDLITREQSPVAPPSAGGGSPSPYRFRLYVGDAARTYKAPGIEISQGSRPYFADVDDDGQDDLVIFTDVFDGVRTIGTDVAILRSRGDGTFERLAPFRIPSSPQFDAASKLLAADIDHDGVTDLVVRSVDDLVIMRGTGGGHFTVESRYFPFNTYGGWSTRLGDIDGDSNLDIVTTGLRSVRVFFGDGRGHFARTARAMIPRLHDPVGLPAGTETLWNFDAVNSPRDIAVGHLTRSDRDQIAAGTVEGDLIILSYEDGVLRETSRTQTDFWHLSLHPGSFRSTTGTDLYILGTLIWGGDYAKPRVFFAADRLTGASAPVRTPSRMRVSGRTQTDNAMRVQISGECMDASSDALVFAREGMFGIAKRGDLTIEAAFDAGMDVRVSAPFLKLAAVMTLTRNADGTYHGTNQAMTACGWKTITVSASAQ
jgi:hypothetical protein